MKLRLILPAGLLFFATLPAVLAIGGIDAPPAPSAPHESTFSQPKETKLANGLRVVVVERPGLPLLAVELLVRSGAEVDGKDLAGTASMTGSLLTRGTETMSAPQIATAIESLGGSIDSGAHWERSSATVVVMSDKAEPALRILSDVVLHPTFKQEEIDRLKNQMMDGLRVALRQPGALSQFVAGRVLFGDAPYGHSHTGTMESVQAIKRDDIVKLYQAYYVPENAALVLAGNLTLEQGRKYAEEFFGEWKGPMPVPAEKASAPTADWKPSNIVVDMPEAGQAAVTVARPGIKRSAPDYYAGVVANAALGTGFVSRLNREIRIKRGLSYGARSSLDARRDVGPFMATAQTKNQSAAEVANLMQVELKRMKSEPVQGEELKSRQAVITGAYARQLETNGGFVGKISAMITNDLALDTLNKFIPSINAITGADVTAFAAKYFDTPPSLIIIGKAPDFIEPLRKDFPDVKVIPVPELDLNRADLTKPK
ncbi:MAG TPA: pitrilysin family protein [Chthoniobacterales bacterium]|nr:pitrilysin family protein [Chthoniobacterales bacterium]